MELGSIVFGPKWDKPTAVGGGDGGTFIAQPVYRHELVKLLVRICELEDRITKLEQGA